MINIETEGESLSFELDTEAVVSSIAFEQFKNLSIDKKIFKHIFL